MLLIACPFRQTDICFRFRDPFNTARVLLYLDAAAMTARLHTVSGFVSCGCSYDV